MRDAPLPLLAPEEVLDLHRQGQLPRGWRVRARRSAALWTFGTEELTVTTLDPAKPHFDLLGVPLQIGDVLCVRSGARITWRRVLALRGEQAFVRGDVTPFADGWLSNGGAIALLGRVRPRSVDVAVRLDPHGFTRANWLAALALGRVKAARRRLHVWRAPRPSVRFRARLLEPSQWPEVLSFWLRASGRVLPLASLQGGYVVGLFAESANARLDESRLVGVNIQLVTGEEAYSAYTMIERAYRGRGVSRILLDEALRVAESLELSRVYVHIHARNVPSLAAYRRAGFRFSRWWTDDADPLLSAERQWQVYERVL